MSQELTWYKPMGGISGPTKTLHLLDEKGESLCGNPVRTPKDLVNWKPWKSDNPRKHCKRCLGMLNKTWGFH